MLCEANGCRLLKQRCLQGRIFDETGAKEITRKHGTHLRVPVLPEEEEEAIKKNAAAAGMTVAAFLRSAGIGYQIKGIVDNKEVEKLAKINGDLGRLGGVIKTLVNE